MDDENKTFTSLMPTWKAAAQIYIMCLESGSDEGMQAAREGILEMGEKLDVINAHLEAGRTVVINPDEPAPEITYGDQDG